MLIGLLEFGHHALVLPGAIAGLGVGVECSVVDGVHLLGFRAGESALFYGRQELLEEWDVLLAHGHATTWKELVEFLLSFVTSAVFYYSMDELIYPRCFRQLGYLVAQPLGVLF